MTNLSRKEKLERALDMLGGCNMPTSCITAALAVRDFLRSIGVTAEVKSVVMDIRNPNVMRAGTCGAPESVGPSAREMKGWHGHLVVVLPNDGILIDPTFGQFRRPWCEWIPDVAIVEDLAKGACHLLRRR